MGMFASLAALTMTETSASEVGLTEILQYWPRCNIVNFIQSSTSLHYFELKILSPITAGSSVQAAFITSLRLS